MGRLFNSVRPRQAYLRPASIFNGGKQSGYRTSSSTAAVVFAIGAAGAIAASDRSTMEAALCDTTAKQTTGTSENPLWPSGVSNEVVNKYVDEILANDMINISALPDSIERMIYSTTIRLTLNAVYRWLSLLHGINLLGHHLELTRTPGSADSGAGLDFAHNSGTVHESAIEDLAEQLLANKSVEQWFIPDVVERQVYRNCLKLIFGIIDRVADTLSIRLCGHELSLSFEPHDAHHEATVLANRY